MKKTNILSLLLILFIVMNIFNNYGINNVYATTNLTLEQLKSKFPSGKYWNHNGSNNPDGYTSNPVHIMVIVIIMAIVHVIVMLMQFNVWDSHLN